MTLSAISVPAETSRRHIFHVFAHAKNLYLKLHHTKAEQM